MCSCLDFQISSWEATFKLLYFILVLRMFIRAFTAAHIELWSNSSPFVQLQCFQMRGGKRCLVLNLNLSFIFCTFLPHLKTFLHIRNTFLRVHMAFRGVGFFYSLYCNALCVPHWAGSRRLEQEEGFLGTVLRGSSSSGLEELSMHRDPLLQPVGF